MQICFVFLRSIAFYIVSFIATCILFIPALFGIILGNVSLILSVSKIWASLVLTLLDFICGLKVKVIGLDNLKHQPVVIAAKHQSALETLFIYKYLDEGKYILKNSLRYIPFLGTCFAKLGMIFIDRRSPLASIRMIKAQAKELLALGKSIIIFPEGTRVAYGTAGKYSPGIAAIYEDSDADIIPVALNTGKFWRRNSILKYPGVCFIEFLPPMPRNLSKDQFMNDLRQAIEEKCQ